MALNVDPAHIAKIKVSREGVISLNDQPVTIEELKASLLKDRPTFRFSRFVLQGERSREPSSQRRAGFECDYWCKTTRQIILET